MKDYYYILGISKTSTESQIKSAYRKLSIKFHPDKNEGDKFFEERFKEINEAYEILSNIYKRVVYDDKFTKTQFVQDPSEQKLYEDRLKKKYEEDFKQKEEEIRRKYQTPEQRAAEETEKRLREDELKKKEEFQKLINKKNDLEKSMNAKQKTLVEFLTKSKQMELEIIEIYEEIEKIKQKLNLK